MKPKIPFRPDVIWSVLGFHPNDAWALGLVARWHMRSQDASEDVLAVFHEAVKTRNGKKLRALAEAVEYDVSTDANNRLVILAALHLHGDRFTHRELTELLKSKGIQYADDGGRQLRRDMKQLGLRFKNSRKKR